MIVFVGAQWVFVVEVVVVVSLQMLSYESFRSFRMCFFWAVFMNTEDSCWGMCFLNAHSTPISVSGSHGYAQHEGLAAHFASIL